MEKQEMIKKFKESTNKLQCIDTLCAETGLTAVDVIKVLIEHKIDGRIFRQGRFAAEYREAKKMVIEESVKAAAAANASLKEIREENERLKSEADDKCGTCDYKNRVQFLEDENKRLNTAIEEIDKLKKDADKVIEVLQDKLNKLQEDYDKIAKENEDLKTRLDERFESEMDAEIQNDSYSDALLDAKNQIAELEGMNEKLSNSLNEESWKLQKMEQRYAKYEKFILDSLFGDDDNDI